MEHIESNISFFLNETVSVIQTKDNFWLFEFVLSPWVHGSVNFWERVATDTIFFGGDGKRWGEKIFFPILGCPRKFG